MKFAADFSQFLRDEWRILVPVALGFVAVYLLLPRVRRSGVMPGALLGAAALIAAGGLLVHGNVLSVETILFYAFSGIAMLGAGLMLTHHNPVRAALSFTLVVLSTCGLFLLLAAPFLMAATIIIYAGAIIITFLFVVMLAQQAGLTSADTRSREPFLASLAGFVLLVGLLVVLERNYNTSKYEPALATLQQVVDAGSLDEINRILIDPAQQKAEKIGLPLVEELRDLFPREDAAIEAIEGAFYFRDKEGVQAACKKVLEMVQRAKAGQGSLQPDAKLALSPFSGAPPNTPFLTEPRERLPASNVAGLGKSLFTDHLIAVELAGVLLLVATIGAIIIAGRRGEVLR